MSDRGGGAKSEAYRYEPGECAAIEEAPGSARLIQGEPGPLEEGSEGAFGWKGPVGRREAHRRKGTGDPELQKRGELEDQSRPQREMNRFRI